MGAQGTGTTTAQAIRRWVALIDGVQSGPFAEPTLLAQIEAGEIPSQALVSCGSGWLTAQEMAEGSRAAAPPPPPPEPPPPEPAPPEPASPEPPPPEPAAPAMTPAPAAPALASDPDAVLDAEIVEDFWEDDRAPQAGAQVAPAPSAAPPTTRPAPSAGRPSPPPLPPLPSPPAPGAMRLSPVDLAAPAAPAPPPLISPFPGLPPLPPMPRPLPPVEARPVLGTRVGASPSSAAASTSPAAGTRDRVVVLGRRQSGKTIYLAALYARLWRSLNGMTARAKTGDVHKQLMDAVDTLKRGEWPPATLETSHLEMEIEYHGRKHAVVMLDFAGEVFARAFVHEQTEGAEARALLAHIDGAAAVLLLVDPSVVGDGGDAAAVMEDDFGLVQAVQRIRAGPGGDQVPIALCLTKIDVNGQLVAGMGGAKELVKRLFPPLVRMLKQVTVFSLSAVQVAPGPDGRPRPRPDSKPVNLENPLKHCLRVIHANEDAAARQRAMDEAWVAQQLEERRAKQRERRQNMWLVIGIGALVLIGLIVIIGVSVSVNR